jgi:putative DNA primase/helicase
LVIAEGIETALAARELTNLPAWATVSAIGMLKVELPANIRQVYIAIDADASGTGERAGNSLARRLKAEGREVWILDPRSELGPLPLGCKGFDWLDVLNAKEAAASNAS